MSDSRPRLDDADRRLVGALHLRPRASFDELGSVLGADPTTVRRRYARLVDQRLLRVVGQVDWATYSTTLPVHLFVDSTDTAPGVLADRLRGLAAVQHLVQCTGRSPVFATVHAASEEATAELIEEVHAVAGVSRVRSLPVLAAEARGAGWDPLLLDAEERERVLSLPAPDLESGAEHAPTLPLGGAERAVVELLRQDGRASAAALGRATGLASSTAHRVVRRVLDLGWVRPRVEIEPALLGFATPFVLRASVVHGQAQSVLHRLTALPQTRFTTRVAGEVDVVCTGLVADRAALARLVDEDLAGLEGLVDVEIDVVLAERRRYWLDRGPGHELGAFSPPPLLG